MEENTPKNKIKAISKELKELSDNLKLEGNPNYHNEARMLINKKYGKGWREELTIEDMKLNPGFYKFQMSYL